MFLPFSLWLLFFSCYSSGKRFEPNDSPESVMKTIFQAARTGEVGVLQFLLPPDGNCDGDCKALCNPGNESMREELRGNFITVAEFREYFSQGKIVGIPIIEGNAAKVNFVFGPNLEESETMGMQKIGEKWYLSGY